MNRNHDLAGAAIAGGVLLSLPTADLLLGAQINGAHAVLGMTGLEFLVATLPDRMRQRRSAARDDDR